jgi:L-2-amino-thiazoline-4-carboxylic acid hydrolase
MASLTEAATARFGETASVLVQKAQPLSPPPGWRDDDFVEVLLLQAVPWMRTMMAAFGRDQVNDLVAESMARAMHEFGRRALADSDGTVAGRIERALAPIPPDALTIEDRRIDDEQVGFKVTRCRYTEILTQIGAHDLGPVLVCNHDFAIAEGMGLGLQRSQTLMTSGRPCDFQYSDLQAMKRKAPSGSNS